MPDQCGHVVPRRPTPSPAAPQHRAPAGGAEAGFLSTPEAGRYERRGAGELPEEILHGHGDTHPLSQRKADEKGGRARQPGSAEGTLLERAGGGRVLGLHKDPKIPC